MGRLLGTIDSRRPVRIVAAVAYIPPPPPPLRYPPDWGDPSAGKAAEKVGVVSLKVAFTSTSTVSK